MSTTLNEMLLSCEQEKLHLSNAIQSFGVLIRLNKKNQITHVSSNISDILGLETSKILGQPISVILGEHFNPQTGMPTTLNNRHVTCGVLLGNGSSYDIISTQVDTGYLVEIEPCDIGEKDGISKSHLLSRIFSLSRSQESLETQMQKAAELVKEVSGFAKVMVYQFQDDWSGEVICETGGEEHFDCYYGLRFPASDIPKIARDLYLKTPYRLIADVNADTADLKAIGNDSIDLTYADLRSVSPVHITYLKNMQVGASLSFPIVINEKLWGLFALHHPQARYLPVEKLNHCTDVAHAFCLSLKNDLFSKRMALIDSADHKISKVLQALDFKSGTSLDLMSIEQQLLDLVQAKSGAIFDGEQFFSFGQAVDEAIMICIDEWFLAQEDSSFFTDTISMQLPECLDSASQVSGVMALRVLNKHSKQYLRFYWYRPELPQEINWAGNPQKPVTQNHDTLPISPRHSFEKWTETTAAKSSPWTRADNMVAMKFRSLVLKMVLR